MRQLRVAAVNLPILLLDIVRDTVEANGLARIVCATDGPIDLERCIERHRPEIVLLGFDNEGELGELSQLLRRRHGGLRLVGIERSGRRMVRLTKAEADLDGSEELTPECLRDALLDAAHG